MCVEYSTLYLSSAKKDTRIPCSSYKRNIVYLCIGKDNQKMQRVSYFLYYVLIHFESESDEKMKEFETIKYMRKKHQWCRGNGKNGANSCRF